MGFPMRWTDKIAAFDCMPDETKTQDPYRFEYYCREPNCFSLYENQATHYQWDSTCRKCIPCTVNECRPPNLDTGPKFPCEKTKEGCTTEKPVNCGEHGTNANSYSCKCDPGWKNNVQAGTFCDIVEVKGDATLAANPEEDAKTQQTTTYVILILVGVFLVLLALCSCCCAYFCKRSKENQEVLRFVRQGGHADNSASSGVAKQVQFMKMNSRKKAGASLTTPSGETISTSAYNSWQGMVKKYRRDVAGPKKYQQTYGKRSATHQHVDSLGGFLSVIHVEKPPLIPIKNKRAPR